VVLRYTIYIPKHFVYEMLLLGWTRNLRICATDVNYAHWVFKYKSNLCREWKKCSNVTTFTNTIVYFLSADWWGGICWKTCNTCPKWCFTNSIMQQTFGKALFWWNTPYWQEGTYYVCVKFVWGNLRILLKRER